MLTFALGFKLGLSLLELGLTLSQMQNPIAGPISGPLRKLVDGTVDLAYRRGCLDGALVASVIVMILMYRRQYQCHGENS